MDGIKDKIGKLIDEVKEKTTDFKDKAEDTFEEVKGKAEALKDKAGEAYKEVKERAEVLKTKEGLDMDAEQAYRMPLIGDKAPSFKAVTTQGNINFPEDYYSKWVILFSHPADFTPVCTTEFMTFATMEEEFKALNTSLVGLSVDSLYAHIAWLRKIQELEWNGMKNVEVKFPLIEDIKMEVAKKYGMIQPGQSTTQAVRAVFVIDPKGTIRTILYYPLSTGRNFDEIKRIIIALQKADADQVATPANWRPGQDVIVPTAGSCGAAKERMENQTEDQYCLDWFLCFRREKK